MPDSSELPSGLRERLRRRLSETEIREYFERRGERMDRHVEKIIEDYERNEALAERLHDVSEFLEAHREELTEELRDQDLLSVVDLPPGLEQLLPQLREAFTRGKFELAVDTGQEEDRARVSVMIDLPEGNVSEKLPLKQNLSQRFVDRAQGPRGEGSAPQTPSKRKAT